MLVSVDMFVPDENGSFLGPNHNVMHSGQDVAKRPHEQFPAYANHRILRTERLLRIALSVHAASKPLGASEQRQRFFKPLHYVLLVYLYFRGKHQTE
jgi:hypothetical protein